MITTSRWNRPSRRPAAALLLSAGLVLSACGGSDDDAAAPVDEPAATAEASPTEAEPTATPSEESSAPAESSPAEEGGGTVAVSAFDFGYELESTELAAGEYTIEMVNDGDASHNVVVERDGEDVAGTDVVNGGETASVTVDLEPGEYVFYCSVGNHRGQGMEVTVTVT